MPNMLLSSVPIYALSPARQSHPQGPMLQALTPSYSVQMYVSGMSTGAFLAVAFASRKDLHPQGGLAGCIALACVDDIPYVLPCSLLLVAAAQRARCSARHAAQSLRPRCSARHAAPLPASLWSIPLPLPPLLPWHVVDWLRLQRVYVLAHDTPPCPVLVPTGRP